MTSNYIIKPITISSRIISSNQKSTIRPITINNTITFNTIKPIVKNNSPQQLVFVDPREPLVLQNKPFWVTGELFKRIQQGNLEKINDIGYLIGSKQISLDDYKYLTQMQISSWEVAFARFEQPYKPMIEKQWPPTKDETKEANENSLDNTSIIRIFKEYGTIDQGYHTQLWAHTNKQGIVDSLFIGNLSESSRTRKSQADMMIQPLPKQCIEISIKPEFYQDSDDNDNKNNNLIKLGTGDLTWDELPLGAQKEMKEFFNSNKFEGEVSFIFDYWDNFADGKWSTKLNKITWRAPILTLWTDLFTTSKEPVKMEDLQEFIHTGGWKMTQEGSSPEHGSKFGKYLGNQPTKNGYYVRLYDTTVYL